MQQVVVYRANAMPTPAQKGDQLLWALANACYAWMRDEVADSSSNGLPEHRPSQFNFSSIDGANSLRLVPFWIDDRPGWGGRVATCSISNEISLLSTDRGVNLGIRIFNDTGSNYPASPLVAHLLTDFRLEIDDLRIRVAVEAIERRGVDKLVARLFSQARTLPIVVMSRNEQGRLSSEPLAVAEALIGLAFVVQLSDGPTSDELLRRLGPELSTMNGAVRVFWPGLTASDSGYFHRVFTPSGANDWAFADRLPTELHNAIARLSSRRLQPDRRVVDAILLAQMEMEHIAEARTHEADPVPDDTSTIPISPSYDHLIDEQHSTHESIVHDLETRLAASEAARQQLELDVFNLSERLKISSLANTFDPALINFQDLISEATAVTSLAELVKLFERAVDSDAIVFLPEAHATAVASPYAGNLAGPAKMLRNLCTVATRYHTGDLRGGEDFKRAFHLAGEARYASDSSPTTLGKYRTKYERTYVTDGRAQSILLRPHMSFGSGRAHSSVKIYWYVDEINRRFVVGQIGEHLPIAKRF